MPILFFFYKQLVVDALFLTEATEGTIIKKERVPFQFSVSLFHELHLLFCVEFVMEETTLQSTTLESNTKQSQKLQMALSPLLNSKKGEGRTGERYKDLVQRKNGAQAGKMVVFM